MEIKNYIGKYKTGEWYQRPQDNITKITVHHSAIPLSRFSFDDDDSLLAFIQDVHEGKGWPGLAYHFVITGDGTIYQTNNFTDITWHDTINNDSIGILVNGYFHPDVNDKPTAQQLISLKELLDWLCTQNPQFPADHDDVVGHRDRSQTACPGDFLYPYVTEYRQNLGEVDWASTDPCHEIREDRDYQKAEKEKYKAEARTLRTEVEELGEEIRTFERNQEVLVDARNKAEEQLAGCIKSRKEIEDTLKKELADKNKHIESLITKNKEMATSHTNEINDLRLDYENKLTGVRAKLAECEAHEEVTLMSFSWSERFKSLFRR